MAERSADFCRAHLCRLRSGCIQRQCGKPCFRTLHIYQLCYFCRICRNIISVRVSLAVVRQLRQVRLFCGFVHRQVRVRFVCAGFVDNRLVGIRLVGIRFVDAGFVRIRLIRRDCGTIRQNLCAARQAFFQSLQYQLPQRVYFLPANVLPQDFACTCRLQRCGIGCGGHACRQYRRHAKCHGLFH